MGKGYFKSLPAIIQVTEMRLSYGFAGDCFPLTFELSEQLKPHIASYLPRRKKWHFNDRVILWLSPELEPDLREFYQGGGEIFLMRYDEAWAHKLDRELLRELITRLESLNPGMLAMIAGQ